MRQALTSVLAAAGVSLSWTASALAAAPAAPAALAPVELRLAMDPLEAQILFRKEPYDLSSFPVQLVDGGGTRAGRVVVTGSSSRRFLKKSLQVRLDGGATWRENARVSLKAMATDASYLREWAAWDLAHALGMVAPRTEMVRLFINDAFIGPFMFFDWIDAGMMSRRGWGRDGALYHPKDETYCGGLDDARLETLKRCWSQFAPRDGDFAELAALARELDATQVTDFDRYLDAQFDADSVLNWIVLNTITSNTDSYNKNYFLYRSRQAGRWVVVPWDFDLSFGRNADPVLPFPRSIFNDNYQYFYSPELGNPHPLKEKLLRNAALYARFKARLAHVLGIARDPGAPDTAFGWFEPGRFAQRLQGWQTALAADVAQDRYRGLAPGEFERHVAALADYNLSRYHLLTHQVLGVTVFGTPRWLPYTAYPLVETVAPAAGATRQRQPLDLVANVSLPAGSMAAVAVDAQFSRPVAMLRAAPTDHDRRIRVEVETERVPVLRPPGMAPGQCVERTWFVDLKTPGGPVDAGLRVDYLEESSLRHEIGADVRDQSRLVLWAHQGEQWRRLTTRANPVSKVLDVDTLTLRPGQVTRLVACVDG